MKPLETSPQMGKVKYPEHELCNKLFKAVLYCVYYKSEVAKVSEGQPVFPNKFFLKLEKFDTIFNVTSDNNDKSRDVLLDNIGFVGKLKYYYRFRSGLVLTEDATDTDKMLERPRPYPCMFYPVHAFVKTVQVYVVFSGLDDKGQSVWKIELEPHRR